MDIGLSIEKGRQGSVKLLFALAMAKRDIIFIQDYLKSNLKNSLNFEQKLTHMLTVHVVYARIFSKNSKLPKINIKTLGCNLSTNEEALHCSLIQFRNKIYAHNDAIDNFVQISINRDGEIDATAFHNIAEIDKASQTADSLFNKVLRAIERNITVLLKNLYGQENAYKVSTNSDVLLQYNDKNILQEHFFILRKTK